MATVQYTLRKLADFLGADLRGDPNCPIFNIAPLDRARAGDISFLEKSAYRDCLVTTLASAVILRLADAVGADQLQQPCQNFLIVKDPYVAYAKVSSLFATKIPTLPAGIHSSAVVGACCTIDTSAAIGANCVVGNNVIIGKNTVMDAGCVVGDHVVIGDDTKLYANVTIYYGVHVGSRVIIHSGAVIGADGFGMANDSGVWCKIYQLGSVVIGDDVEIGANTTIDRGALVDTVIGNGVKIDNQVQVGHNVQIGEHTAIAGCVGIAGSTRIGKHCMIGGGAGINGHITIADGTIVTASSNIHKSITQPDIYASGIPAVSHRTWWRILKRLFQLDEIVNRLKKLEQEFYGYNKHS